MHYGAFVWALALQHPPPQHAHCLPHSVTSPSLSHTFISPLWVDKEQLCLPLCTSLKEPFIAAGRGTSAHLPNTEGFNFTTPCLLATCFQCKHSQGKCAHTLSWAQTERQGGKKLHWMRNRQMLSQTLDQGETLGSSFPSCIEFHPRKGRFHC